MRPVRSEVPRNAAGNRARRTGHAAATLLALALPLAGIAAPAAALAPSTTGWWSCTARAGLPAPPNPPDLAEGDLLVQAGDPSGLAAGGKDACAPSAVAALRFTLPTGTEAAALTLRVGDSANARDIRAYATTSAWSAAAGAPLAQAPTADRTRFSVGVLSGTTLVFADIERLAPASGPLSIVLLPGPTDRVVVRQPGPDALTVSAEPAAGVGAGPAVPPVQAGADPGSPDPGSPDPGSPATGNSSWTAPVAGLGDVAAETTPADGPALATGSGLPVVAVPAPQLALIDSAPAAANGGLAIAGARPAALQRLGGLQDNQTRYLAAAQAVLVLATFGLLGWGPMARLATLTGAALPQAGGLRRGVGRFTAERTGKVVRL